MASSPHEADARPSRSIGRRRAVRITLEILAIALGVHLLWPRIGGFAEVGSAIGQGNLLLIPVVIALEAVSVAAYGEMVRVVLRSMGEQVSRGLIQRTTLVGIALGRTLPGGTTAVLPVIVNTLRGVGLDGSRATAALATSGVLSSFVLALLLVPAVVLAIVGGQGGGVALSAALAAVMIIAGAVAVAPSVRNPDAAGQLVERLLRRIVPARLRRRLDPVAAGKAVARAVDGIHDLLRDPRAVLRSLGLATSNWLADVAALAVVAVTVGRGTPLTAILLAYVIGQLAAAIPLTPGGIGIVETAMIGSLVAAGAPAGAATATVLGWRLFSFWLPIVAGFVVLPTLPGRRRAVRPRQR
jgi:uncharacterized protein (TIRG00374 family)